MQIEGADGLDRDDGNSTKCRSQGAKAEPMSEPKALKPFPSFTTDAEAEAFVDAADLSEYDFSDFHPTNLKIRGGMSELRLPVPSTLLAAIKDVALAKGITYTNYIREMLERDVAAEKR